MPQQILVHCKEQHDEENEKKKTKKQRKQGLNLTFTGISSGREFLLNYRLEQAGLFIFIYFFTWKCQCPFAEEGNFLFTSICWLHLFLYELIFSPFSPCEFLVISKAPLTDKDTQNYPLAIKGTFFFLCILLILYFIFRNSRTISNWINNTWRVYTDIIVWFTKLYYHKLDIWIRNQYWHICSPLQTAHWMSKKGTFLQ